MGAVHSGRMVSKNVPPKQPQDIAVPRTKFTMRAKVKAARRNPSKANAPRRAGGAITSAQAATNSIQGR